MSGIGTLTSGAIHHPNEQLHKGKLLFSMGVCTDLHHDLIKDGPERLQAFITKMNELKPDFIIQMGDFCVPKPANQVIMDIWNQFKGPKHHVIGNHDTDGGFTHDQVIEFWNAKAKRKNKSRKMQPVQKVLLSVQVCGVPDHTKQVG